MRLNLTVVIEKVSFPAKCKFFKMSLEFFSHVESENGINCDPKKTEVVKSLSKLTRENLGWT